MKKKVVVVGAGGHAKVVIDAIEQQNKYEIIGIIDKTDSLKAQYQKYKVLGGEEILKKLYQDNSDIYVVIAIGENTLRYKIYNKLLKIYPQIQFATIIHPNTNISSNVQIGEGTVIMPYVTLGVDAVIGNHVIINTNVTIEHDCIIEDFCSLSPKVALAGTIKVKSGAFIGTGVSIIPGVEIGKNTIVGAGAVVIHSLPDNITAVGCPAKVIKEVEQGVYEKNSNVELN